MEGVDWAVNIIFLGGFKIDLEKLDYWPGWSR